VLVSGTVVYRVVDDVCCFIVNLLFGSCFIYITLFILRSLCFCLLLPGLCYSCLVLLYVLLSMLSFVSRWFSGLLV